MKSQKMPAWLSGPLIIGAFAALVWLERRRPLRREVEPKLTRTARNLAVAGIGALALQLTESPVALGLAALVAQHDLGLLKLVRLPVWLETALAIVLLDYTLYVWHVLTHKVHFLWRFHLVHHVDLDLDASTALRFHFGELAISVPWRAAQVIIIGVSPITYLTWQTFVFLSIMFHHSNVELPISLERWLNRLIVTPRMHGIHHSVVPQETNSNWSSGLTIWDWLHGTLRLNVPQDQVTIGVPAYRKPAEVSLLQILALPFLKQRSDWTATDGSLPAREVSPVVGHELLP
jgi:sterol desaturase/sphingolipid hydroxylase (fatty acid hydroxylase superfamily)